MSDISVTPAPPYYAVIFTSHMSKADNGYSQMSELMLNLAAKQAGYLGVESAREGIGITVSYWSDLQSIKNWKANSEHQIAQHQGREKWYQQFKVRICKVEMDYSFTKDGNLFDT